jgi:hypothetical protein
VTFANQGAYSNYAWLVVDGVQYGANNPSQNSYSFQWGVGTSHTFQFLDPLPDANWPSLIRYMWVSTSGLSTAKSGTIVVPGGGGSVTASYKTQYYITIRASPSGGGTVSPASGWYDSGYSITISATAASGYAFINWTGVTNLYSNSNTYSGTSSTASFIINGPITETAYFFSFSLSVSPSTGTVVQGGSTTATVTVTLISGTPQTVSLSASGLPSGATASFSPSSGTPTYSSTMTIQASTSTPVGTYTITITGTYGSLTQSTTYTLTVNTPPVTFSQSGMSSDASGTVLTVDGVTYTYSQLPVTFVWPTGSSHSFA